MRQFRTLASFLFLIIVSGLVLAGCTFSLEKESRAGIQINTAQVESAVFINGQYLDKTPLIRKNLKPGEYVIEIKPVDEKLAPYETTLTLRQDLLSVITWKPATTPEKSGGVVYEMEPLPIKDASEVSFSTVPDGAIIELLDKPKEIAPYTFKDVPEGEAEYTITLPSYEEQQHTINVVPGYRMLISVKLAKQSDALLQPTPTVAIASPSATTTATGSATITILKTNLFIDGVEVLRVRKEPTVTSEEVAVVPVGKSFPYLGEKKDGWFKIAVASTSGWISGTYANLKEE